MGNLSEFQTGILFLLRQQARSKAGFLGFLRKENSQPIYMGEQRREDFQATGVLDFIDGFMYEGSFNGFVRHGYGKFRFEEVYDRLEEDELQSGCEIEGMFDTCFIHGYAMLRCSEGFRVTTTAHKTKVKAAGGDGEEVTVDDSWGNCLEYKGQWEKNVRHGLGCMVTAEGSELWGTWKADCLVQLVDKDSPQMLQAMESLETSVKNSRLQSSKARQLGRTARRLQHQKQTAASQAAKAAKAAQDASKGPSMGTSMMSSLKSAASAVDSYGKKIKEDSEAALNKMIEAREKQKEEAAKKQKENDAKAKTKNGEEAEELREKNEQMSRQIESLSSMLLGVIQRLTKAEEKIRWLETGLLLSGGDMSHGAAPQMGHDDDDEEEEESDGHQVNGNTRLLNRKLNDLAMTRNGETVISPFISAGADGGSNMVVESEEVEYEAEVEYEHEVEE